MSNQLESIKEAKKPRNEGQKDRFHKDQRDFLPRYDSGDEQDPKGDANKNSKQKNRHESNDVLSLADSIMH